MRERREKYWGKGEENISLFFFYNTATMQFYL